MRIAYCFDDVMLVPQHSEVDSRQDVDISTSLGSDRKQINLKLPIVNAPMEFVTKPLLWMLQHQGGLAMWDRINPKNITIMDDQPAGVAISIKDDFRWVDHLVKMGATFLCVDTANGHQGNVIRFVEKLRQEFPRTHIMAGNVSTHMGYADLADAGADSVRVGIGEVHVVRLVFRLVTACRRYNLSWILQNVG